MSGEEKQFKTHIQIGEYQGLDRCNEPVTAGIPFPEGEIDDLSSLCLINKKGECIHFQSSVLAAWPDKSIKWGLFDFQHSSAADEICDLVLTKKKAFRIDTGISVETKGNKLLIDTGAAVFTLDTQIYKPFAGVRINGHDIIDPENTGTEFTDSTGTAYEPTIDQFHWETDGPIRKTLTLEGHFPGSPPGKRRVRFVSRIFFYWNKSFVRIDFSLLNPNAAKHQGGLWDLGDPGSVLFSDLNMRISLKLRDNPGISECIVKEDTSLTSNSAKPVTACERVSGTRLNIYQDSSGGDNWACKNHVNRDGVVRNQFKGFRLYSDDQVLFSGARALPVMTVKDSYYKISGTIKNFWQNFPNALEGKENCLFFRMFPCQYDDFFELQGGEQKTHTVYISLDASDREIPLDWVDFPLIVSAAPETYAKAGVFPYLVPDTELDQKDLLELVNSAIEGDRSFFKRREIIDEYGWRNFGELYADHEAVGNTSGLPFVSHYNNQYDCINGFLYRFAASGDFRWFLLADQLAGHVKDIDIYHTDDDKLEFNHGLFWHTNHHKEAETATHRCYSRHQVGLNQLSGYGGGPALSHCYTTGLLNHYYMTGDTTSKEAVKELASFMINNVRMERTLIHRSIKKLKSLKKALINKTKGRVVLEKIYGLNGPGRSSGNALTVLMDAYVLTGDPIYLNYFEQVVYKCIHPKDDIEKRELLDVENRWMYTIFLVAIAKFIDLKSGLYQYEETRKYLKASLLHYGQWMAQYEQPYLRFPEKLDYPNETWAAQDYRKSAVFIHCLKNAENEAERKLFQEKAEYFQREAFKDLKSYPAPDLTRPVVLVLQNAFVFESSPINTACPEEHGKQTKHVAHNILKKIQRAIYINIKDEYKYLKQRL